MEQEVEVCKGVLSTSLCTKNVKKKPWPQKVCCLFKPSKFGLQRLEIWDHNEKTPKGPLKIVTLENCVKITSDGPTQFSIHTKTAPFIFEFSAPDAEAKQHWLDELQKVSFPDDLSQMTSIEEDNDLYCSTGEGVYDVRVFATEASQRCGLDCTKNYTLILTVTAIQLRDVMNGALLYTWPYCYVRKYGLKRGKFTFEAGRKCESGEGSFYFEHPNHLQIHKCLASKMKAMKNLKENSASLASLHSTDSQLQVAFSMEARSRTPLPFLPPIQHPIMSEPPSLHSSTTSVHSVSTPKPKPPRKNNPSPSDNYEPIEKYAEVECINEAWRTRGMDNVSHMEHVGGGSSEEIDKSRGDGHKGGGVAPPLVQIPKVVTMTNTRHVDDYDKLNFFGSVAKLNANSGYKQIALNPNSTGARSFKPSLNDYDEVDINLEGVRLADDSHLGYAVVRKDNLTCKLNNNAIISNTKDVPNHRFYNEEPYAVISKPKRV